MGVQSTMMPAAASGLAQAAAIPNRAKLRADLEATRAAFHTMVDVAAGERWHAKSATSAWTVGEVFEHLTWALEQLPKEIESARRGKGMFNMPKWIADPGSFWITRWEARKSDPQSLHRRYDAAMARTLAALGGVPDSDWGLGARFYGHGFYTVVDLFRTPTEHLAEHTAQM